MTIPKIIHFIETRAIAGDIARCIQKARALHPDWNVRIWTDPRGQMSGPLKQYLDKVNSPAQMADLFRLDILYREGGFYLDTDMYLHRSLDVLTSFEIPLFCANSYGGAANNFIGSPPLHRVIKDIIDFLLTNEPDWSRPPNETTGPHLFTALLRGRTDIFVLPRVTFLPYRHDAPPALRKPHRLSFAEHLGNHSWRAVGSSRDLGRGGSDGQWLWTLLKRSRRTVKATAKRILRKGRKRAVRLIRDAVRAEALALGRWHPVTEEAAVRNRYGQWLFVDGREIWIHEFAVTGTRDADEEELLCRVLGAGDWMVDVGANYGMYTVLGAHLVGPFGRVIAFEPNPQVRSFLIRTVHGNWFKDRIQVRCEALMDKAGEFILEHPQGLSGLGQLVKRSADGDSLPSPDMKVLVRAERFNSVVPPWLPIRVLKIDVEGNEDRVLEGALPGIRNGQFDWIIVEAEPWRGAARWAALRTSLRTLQQQGYVPCIIERDGTWRAADSLEDALRRRRSLNLVFGHNEAVEEAY